jgi:hypothetical protein
MPVPASGSTMTRTISFFKSEPVLSRIPVATPGEKLHVRHDA